MWYAVVGIVCFLLGWGVTTFLSGRSRPDSIGTMNVVEWSDGTYDLLLQLEESPSGLGNGQKVMVNVHKTRR